MPNTVPQSVVVRLPHKLANLEQANKVMANVLGRLGCAGCLSGFDIRFTHAIDLAIDAKTLGVREVGV